jgi:hypothetical protein
LWSPQPILPVTCQVFNRAYGIHGVASPTAVSTHTLHVSSQTFGQMRETLGAVSIIASMAHIQFAETWAQTHTDVYIQAPHIHLHSIHNHVHISMLSHPFKICKLFNIHKGYHLQNRKLQKIYHPTQYYPWTPKNTLMRHIVLAVPYYLFMDQIEEVGD